MTQLREPKTAFDRCFDEAHARGFSVGLKSKSSKAADGRWETSEWEVLIGHRTRPKGDVSRSFRGVTIQQAAVQACGYLSTRR
jgi:hypothetical protein